MNKNKPEEAPLPAVPHPFPLYQKYHSSWHVAEKSRPITRPKRENEIEAKHWQNIMNEFNFDRITPVCICRRVCLPIAASGFFTKNQNCVRVRSPHIETMSTAAITILTKPRSFNACNPKRAKMDKKPPMDMFIRSIL